MTRFKSCTATADISATLVASPDQNCQFHLFKINDTASVNDTGKPRPWPNDVAAFGTSRGNIADVNSPTGFQIQNQALKTLFTVKVSSANPFQ
jgi:hypothetical protein